MFVILRRLSGVNHASRLFAGSRFSTVSVGCEAAAGSTHFCEALSVKIPVRNVRFQKRPTFLAMTDVRRERPDHFSASTAQRALSENT